MSHEIRRLTDEDALNFHSLMKVGYATALGFTVRPEALTWNLSDRFYPTLGVFKDGALVSSMRGEWILSLPELNFKLEGEFSSIKPVFPAMFLTKAATVPEFKKNGYNLVLRYHFFRIAQSWGARLIYGTMVEGSPRVNSLSSMGYKFEKCNKKWDKMFISTADPMMACLDLSEQEAMAFDYINEKVGVMIKEFTARFKHDDFPIIAKLPFATPWP